jgi:hypothetical protein
MRKYLATFQCLLKPDQQVFHLKEIFVLYSCLYPVKNITKKSTATTSKRSGFDSSVFIKVNATWVNFRLSFVARYFGVIFSRKLCTLIKEN